MQKIVILFMSGLVLGLSGMECTKVPSLKKICLSFLAMHSQRYINETERLPAELQKELADALKPKSYASLLQDSVFKHWVEKHQLENFIDACRQAAMVAFQKNKAVVFIEKPSSGRKVLYVEEWDLQRDHSSYGLLLPAVQDPNFCCIVSECGSFVFRVCEIDIDDERKCRTILYVIKNNDYQRVDIDLPNTLLSMQMSKDGKKLLCEMPAEICAGKKYKLYNTLSQQHTEMVQQSLHLLESEQPEPTEMFSAPQLESLVALLELQQEVNGTESVRCLLLMRYLASHKLSEPSQIFRDDDLAQLPLKWKDFFNIKVVADQKQV